MPPGKQAFASAPIVKTQTVACDQAAWPLTLGIAAPSTPVGHRIVFSAPRQATLLSGLDTPNRLTLAALVAPTIPPGALSPTAAPSALGRLSSPDVPNRLTLSSVAVTVPAVAQTWASAPLPAPRSGAVDPVNILPLKPVFTLPPVSAWFASAPNAATRLSAPDIGNLLVLQPALGTPSIATWFASAPALAARLSVDPALYPAIYYPPAVAQGFASAPAAMVPPVAADAVNRLPLGAVTTPSSLQASASAPTARLGLSAPDLANALPLSVVAAPPAIQQLFASAPPPKNPVTVDVFANLGVSTLYVLPPALPTGQMVFASAPANPAAFLIAPQFVNATVLGIPVAPPTPTSVPAGRHHKRYGVMVGDRLLIFNTRDEANRAKAALTAVAEPRLIKVKVAPKPLATIDLPHFKALATAQKVDYAAPVAARDYQKIIDLYRELQSREEEEIAAVILLL